MMTNRSICVALFSVFGALALFVGGCDGLFQDLERLEYEEDAGHTDADGANDGDGDGENQCEEDRHCLNGFYCDGGMCVEEDECSENADCGDGYDCEDNTCVEEQGQDECSEPCDDHLQCVDGECVNPGACTDGSDCSDDLVCVDGFCEEVYECTVDEDCDEGNRCNEEGICESLCSSDEQWMNVFAQCRVVCEPDSDCLDENGDVVGTCSVEQTVCLQGIECLSDDDCRTDYFCDEENECRLPFTELAEPLTCNSSPAPLRCEELDDFGQGVEVTKLELADSDCCSDLTGDGSNDNMYREMLGIGVGGVSEWDEGIALAQTGGFQFFFEFYGLIESNDSIDDLITINVLMGDADASFNYFPHTFEGLMHTRSHFLDATIVEVGDTWELIAVDGTIYFPAHLMLGSLLSVDENITVALRNVELRATLDPGFEPTAGDGNLSGLIGYKDMIGALNEAAVACDCMGDDIFVEDSEGKLTCNTVSGLDNCSAPCEELNTLCVDFAEMVDLFPTFADLDTTGDGMGDSFSFGMIFEWEPHDLPSR